MGFEWNGNVAMRDSEVLYAKVGIWDGIHRAEIIFRHSIESDIQNRSRRVCELLAYGYSKSLMSRIG